MSKIKKTLVFNFILFLFLVFPPVFSSNKWDLENTPQKLNSKHYDISSLREEYDNIIKEFYKNKNELEYESILINILQQLNQYQFSKNITSISDLDWFLYNNEIKNNQEEEKTKLKQQKIAIVVSSYEGLYSTSGIGTVYSILAQYLAKEKGYNVTVVYTRDEPTRRKSFAEWKADLKQDGINLVSLPPSPIRIDNPLMVRKSYQVYQYLKQHQDEFNVIHFPDFEGLGYYTLMAKKDGLFFDRTKMVVGLHGPSSWVTHSNSRKLPTLESELELDYMERMSVEMADIVWTPSNYIVNWLSGQGWKVPSDKLYLLPFLPPQAVANKEQMKLTNGEPTSSKPIRELVFFGRLEQRKGIVLFCDALDILSKSDMTTFEQSKIKVTFLGSPSSIDGVNSLGYVKKRATRWPFQLQYLQDKTSHEALQYLSEPGTDRIAVIPSLEDNAPYTLYECLYNGIPFIASSQQSMIPLIDENDRGSVLFEIKPYSLSRKLTQVLKRGVKIPRPTFSKSQSQQIWSQFYSSLEDSSSLVQPKKLESEPLVSVCIVHFNRASLLKQAIQSIQQQDYKNYEIILVDDGSNATEAILYLKELEKTLFKSNPSWKLIRTPNRYLGAARNTAAKEAKGKYLYFLDDDNTAYPNALSTYVKVAEHTHSKILSAPHSIVSVYMKTPHQNDIEKQWVPLGPSLAVGLFKNCFGDANFFIDRETFIQAGGFTEEVGVGLEDHELLAKLAIHGYKMSVVTEPLLFYRIHDSVNQMVFKTDTKSNQMRYIRPYSQVLDDHKPVLHILARNAVIEKEATCNLTLAYIQPNSGSILGGTSISIVGSGFECPISNVLVGSGVCTNIQIQSNFKSLTCTLPRGTSTIPVDVTVLTGAGNNVTLHSAFTYVSVGGPVVTECLLSESGATIKCSVDPPSDRKSTGCSTFFAQNTLSSFGQNPLCFWTDQNTLTITLGSGSTIDVGDSLEFLPSSIRTVDGEPNNRQTVVLTSLKPKPPIASIKAPTTVGPCDQVVLDGSFSSGGAGRDLTFEWSLISAPDNQQQLRNALSTSANKVNLSNSTLVVGSTYIFGLTVTNWMGESDSTNITISKIGSDVLQVDIFGPSRFTIPSIDLILDGNASMSACSNSDGSAFTYKWTVVPAITLDPNTVNSRSLYIPSTSWVAGTTYTFTLTASVGAQSNEASIQVIITKRHVIALVDGGDKQYSLTQTVTLDATVSKNPDLPEGTKPDFTYKWSCTSYNPAKPYCDLELPDEGVVSFNATKLGAGKFLFSVEVAPADDPTLSGIAIAYVQITGQGFIDIAINKTALPLFIDPGQKLILKSVLLGNTIPVSRLKFLWKLEDGELLVPATEAYSTPTTNRNLGIKSGALGPGTLYTFSVSVEDPTTKASGSASITFRTEARPSGGKITCFTKSGSVMDKYVVDMGRSWSSNSGIAGYSFRYKLTDDGAEVPLGEKSTTNQLSTYLPPGNITVIGYILSGTGIAASSSCSIQVAQPTLEDAERILQFISEQISSPSLSVYQLSNCVKIANSLVPSSKGKALSSAEVVQKVSEIKTNSITLVDQRLTENSHVSTEALSSIIDILSSSTQSGTVLSPIHLSNSMKVMTSITSMMITNPIIPGSVKTSVGIIGNVNSQLYGQLSEDFDPQLMPTAINITRSMESISSRVADVILYRSANGEAAYSVSENGVTITTFKNDPTIFNRDGAQINGYLDEPKFTLQRGILDNSMSSLGGVDEVSTKYVVIPGNAHFDKPLPKDSKFSSKFSFSLDMMNGPVEIPIKDLKEPIVINMGKQDSDYNYKCAWWNADQWSTDGCSTTTDKGAVFCKCTHLTQFGLLGFKKSGSNLARIFIIVGSVVGGVAFAGLLVGMVVFVKRRRNQKKKPDDAKKTKEQKKKDAQEKRDANKKAKAAAKKGKGKGKDGDGDQPSSSNGSTGTADNEDIAIPATSADGKKKKAEGTFGDENEVEYILQEFKDIYNEVKKKEQSEALKRRNPVSPVSTDGGSINSTSASPMPSSLNVSPQNTRVYTEKHDDAARVIQKAWKNYNSIKQLKKEVEVEELLDNLGDLLSDDENDPFANNQVEVAEQLPSSSHVTHDDDTNNDDDDENNNSKTDK
eukprot:gene2777-3451_t